MNRFPRTYAFLLDHLKLEVLYDEIFVSTVESLADASSAVHRYVVEGITRFVAFLAAALGHALRLLHTGKNSAHHVGIVFGIVLIATLMLSPRAELRAFEERGGRFAVRANTGLGYSYRWDSDADGTFDTEGFGMRRSIDVDLEPGAVQRVRVEVKNGFGWIAEAKLDVQGPRAAESAETTSDDSGEEN
jgi:hypothetical protein